jgi:hypothetical protein
MALIEMLSIEEFQAGLDWPKWAEVMKTEIVSLKANGTWELVKCPTNANVVDCKWVYRIKHDSASEIIKHKARLVAQGFTQQYSIDYFDTYAPVAQLASIRTVLAIAA